MGTVVGFECADGAVLAADRVLARGGSVVSRSVDRLFAFDTVGTAVAGDRSGIDTFEREFDAELRSYRTERGEPSLDAVTRLAAEVAADASVDALVVARDRDGRARLRTVSADGSVMDQEYTALGSGAQLALGQLEVADRTVDLSTAAATAERVLTTVSRRDPGTGEEVDVWKLAHAGDD
jgi:proteasome beta subunit